MCEKRVLIYINVLFAADFLEETWELPRGLLEAFGRRQAPLKERGKGLKECSKSVPAT